MSSTIISTLTCGVALVALTGAAAMPADEHRAVTRSGTATVTMSTASGKPAYLVAGVHNGIPPNSFSSYVAGTPAATAAVQTQIPNSMFTGIKLQNARGGQSNLPDPSQGWLYGLVQYQNRFRAWYSNYLTIRQFGANDTLMVNNLWGQENGPNTPSPPPATDGNWTNWDNYLTQLVSDINAAGITTGLDMELWNEPDLQFDNNTHYLETWGRSFHYLRANLPSGIRLVGPGYGAPPTSSTSGVYTEFFDFVKSNGSVPDTYTYHQLSVGSDPAVNRPILDTILAARNLPTKPVYINEYGAPSEQSPSYDAWFISRLERLNQHGLRANWETTSEGTSDYLANTLNKSGTTYSPNGSWRVLSYYAGMTGTRVATTPSADGNFDVYAVRGSSKGSSKIISGSHGTTNPYLIKVTGLTSAGYKSEDTATVIVRQFGWNGLYGAVGAPAEYGRLRVPITHGEMTLGTTASSSTVAYAWEF